MSAENRAPERDTMPVQNHAATGGESTPSIEDLLTEAQAAPLVGLTVGTLRTYRRFRASGQYPHIGPDWINLGRSVFYTHEALEAYRAGTPARGV